MKDNCDLEWTEVGGLERGEFFTLGEGCPLTFVVRDNRIGRSGRVEVDANVLAGSSGARAHCKTFFRPALEVLAVPEAVVGERVAGAIDAWAERNFNGVDRWELPADVWPYIVTDDDAEVVA